MDLKNKVIWITGASSGIGKSLALNLANKKNKINLIQKEKEEVYIGGFKEKLGVYGKRFFPKLLSKLIRKLAVT